MKRIIILSALVILLSSCRTTTSDKLIGEWLVLETESTITMMEDGRAKTFTKNGTSEPSQWEIIDGEPPILKAQKRDQNIEHYPILSITRNTVSPFDWSLF